MCAVHLTAATCSMPRACATPCIAAKQKKLGELFGKAFSKASKAAPESSQRPWLRAMKGSTPLGSPAMAPSTQEKDRRCSTLPSATRAMVRSPSAFMREAISRRIRKRLPFASCCQSARPPLAYTACL